MDGLQASASDDVRQRSSSCCGLTAQRSDERGEAARVSGLAGWLSTKGEASVDWKMAWCLETGSWCMGRGLGLRIESRERALFAGQTHADAAFSNRDAKNRDLNSLQLRSVCTSTHPVFFWSV